MCRPDHAARQLGGKTLGSGSDVWKYWAEKEAGNITEAQWNDMETGIARSFGTCMVMGTAATMMSHAEVLGLTLPGASAIPAADSAHPRMAAMAGKRIVEMVWDDLTPDKILTRQSFENALVVHMAVAGSTNAIIHLIAMAGRAGVPLTPDDFDAFSRKVPVIANIRPSGGFLMEDFYYAGGLPALLKQLKSLLHTDAMTVSGKPLSHMIDLARSMTRTSSARWTGPSRPRTGLPCCAATSPPAAASSSPRRPNRGS